MCGLRLNWNSFSLPSWVQTIYIISLGRMVQILCSPAPSPCSLYSIQEERDYRGYDEDKGWAHAIAHGADALDDLAQCSELEREDLMDILHLIHSKMTITDRVYSDGEDERMVRAVISILNRRLLSKEDVERWIQYFYEAKVSACTDFLPAFRQKNNIKNFLKSLYFQVKFHQTDAALCPVIEQTLYQVDSVYYS